MAPEQVHGKPRPASDQYALVMMVYEWLCGRPAFQGEALAVMFQQVTDPVPLLGEHVPTIAPEVEQVVLKALAKDPQQRFESIQAFAEALNECTRTPLDPTLPVHVQPTHEQQSSLLPQKTKEQWLNEGLAHSKSGQYTEAIESYNQAIKLNPQEADAYFIRGNAYYILQQYDKAIADYDQAIKLNPQEADAQKWRQAAYRLLQGK